MKTMDVKAPAPGTAPVAPPVTANINLQIVAFRPHGGGKIDHKMKLTNPGNRARQFGDSIHIYQGGARLKFTTVPANYRPVNITFTDARTGKPVLVDGSGSPFKNMQVNGPNSTLEVDDNFLMPPAGQRPSPRRYKFSIDVERVSPPGGGVIDPFVENEN
jgi:hypothetical protein